MAVQYVDVPDSDGMQLIVLHADKNLYSDTPYVFDGKPTNAAVMLFAKDTSDYPELELRMGFFRGKDKMVFIDNKQEIGNFFDLHEAGMNFLFRNLRLGGEVKGLLREEKLEIPVEALREALTNALCHRQYERTNGSVSIGIYDDRVEIVNPGNFPPQITADNIRQKHDSYPYNKKIARVLYLSTFLEQWGSGAKRMIDLCREQNVAEPEWIAENGSVKIVFRRSSLGTEENELNENLPKLAQNLSGQVKALLISLSDNQWSKKQVMDLGKLPCKSRETLEQLYLNPAMEQGLVKMLYPESPRHPKQKYLLTDKGRKILELL